jgi:simple sugar transport system permease protein
MIFGNWHPFGAFGAGLLFGFADGLATRVAILQIPIPSEFMLMIPYLVTMIILAGVVGRSQAPAADGVPYDKE